MVVFGLFLKPVITTQQRTHRRQTTTQRRQHILSHTNTCSHNQTQTNTTKHILPQPNTSPISSTDTGPLHSKWHDGLHRNTRTIVFCTMRTCSPNSEPRYMHSGPQGKSEPCVHRESPTGRVGSKRLRVYGQNARMLNICGRFASTHGGVLILHTETFLTYTRGVFRVPSPATHRKHTHATHNTHNTHTHTHTTHTHYTHTQHTTRHIHNTHTHTTPHTTHITHTPTTRMLGYAPRSTDHDPTLDKKSVIYVTSVIFMGFIVLELIKIRNIRNLMRICCF